MNKEIRFDVDEICNKYDSCDKCQYGKDSECPLDRIILSKLVNWRS